MSTEPAAQSVDHPHEAILADAAAKAAAADHAPDLAGIRASSGHQIVRADLFQLLATLRRGIIAPAQQLDDAIAVAAAERGIVDGLSAERANTVDHVGVVKRWVQASPDEAAAVVLIAIYLMTSSSRAQSFDPPKPKEEPTETKPQEVVT